MQSGRILLISFSIICGVFNAACLPTAKNSDNGTGTPENEVKTDVPTEILINKPKDEKPFPAPASIEGGTFFKGQIGASKIDLRLKREGDVLTGFYTYAKIGKPLQLKGKIGKDGKFALEEFDDAGKQTGEFKGIWTEEADKNGAELEGDWKKPTGATTQPFWAYEQMIFFSDETKIVTKSTAEENKKRRMTIETEYPEVTGSNAPNADKFNALAKSFALKKVEDFKKDNADLTEEDLKILPAGTGYDMTLGYNIEFADASLISVQFHIYTYSGGAHGNTASAPLNFDLKTGRELKLADIFKPDSAYLEKISKYCVANLKKRGETVSDEEWIMTGAGASEENYTSWNLTKKGLQITFDAYQVAPYAAGPQTVIVPYSELKEILRDDIRLPN